MPKKTAQTYQELSRQLDDIMQKLQNPDVAIDDATTHYEQAMKLIADMEQHLGQAENRVREIKARFAESA